MSGFTEVMCTSKLAQLLVANGYVALETFFAKHGSGSRRVS